MQNRFLQNGKKTVSGMLIVTFLFSNLFLLLPQKAEAVVPSVPVADILNLESHTVNAIELTADNIKEYILDGLAKMVAQTMIRMLTANIVQWINSGFKGSPAFISNPAGFFRNVGEKVADQFINDNLAFLCSPFKINIQLAISRQAGGSPAQLQCTLGKLEQNYKSFVNGNFRDGGWKGWFSITQNQENNPYGAVLLAKADLNIQIAGQRVDLQSKLDWGKGFFSFDTCDRSESRFIPAGGDTGEQENDGVSAEGGEYVETCLESSTKTPGSIIQGQLDQALPGPLRGLEVADEVNEILTALASQLMNQVLGGVGGLLGASSSSGSGGKPWIERYRDDVAEAGDQNPTVLDRLAKELSRKIDTSLKQLKSTRYDDIKQKSLDVLAEGEASLNSLRDCFAKKIDDDEKGTPKLSDEGLIQAKIGLSGVNTELGVRIFSIRKPIQDDLADFYTASTSLAAIQTKINDQQVTARELSDAAEDYKDLTEKVLKVKDDQQSLNNITDDMDALKEEVGGKGRKAGRLDGCESIQ